MGWRRWVLAAGLLSSMAAWADEVVGLVYPLADVQLSVPVAGVVSSVRVSLGQRVREGQQILQLDASSQSLELKRRSVVAQDTSAQETARQRVEVVDELAAMTREAAERSRSVSREEWLKLRLDQISARGNDLQQRAQKEREKVERDQAQNDLAQRSLSAPRAGVIVALDVDAGEWAKPGDSIVRLVDVSSVDVRLNVPEALARQVRVGAKVSARFEGQGEALRSGKVFFVSPLADAASGLVDVRVRFDNADGRLRPGIKAAITRLNGGA